MNARSQDFCHLQLRVEDGDGLDWRRWLLQPPGVHTPYGSRRRSSTIDEGHEQKIKARVRRRRRPRPPARGPWLSGRPVAQPLPLPSSLASSSSSSTIGSLTSCVRACCCTVLSECVRAHGAATATLDAQHACRMNRSVARVCERQLQPKMQLCNGETDLYTSDNVSHHC